MGEAILINAIGVVAAILILLFFRLGQDKDKKHFLLQVLFLGFIVGLVVLAGKVAYDSKDHCAWLVANDTVSGATTTYNYEYTCETNTNETSSSFYDLTLWIFRITVIYIVLYFAFEVFMYFRNVSLGKKKEGGK